MLFCRNVLVVFFIGIGISSALREGYSINAAFKDKLDDLRNYLKNINPIRRMYNIESYVKFVLFTRNNSTGELLVPNDMYALTISNFGLNKPTKVLIHGFVDDEYGEMATSLTKNFLLVEDVNVIVVDWSNIPMSINYVVAARRTVDVGHYLGKLIDFLVTQGADISGFHVIGFSLGAHVAGTAGRSVKTGVLPRITGLDPALPGFSYPSIFQKLKPSDALFVDCIHTCGGFLGFFEPLCHADFYPNGGKHPQPGCSLIDFGICSHFRSFFFFAESILADHKFPALRCTSITTNSRNCEQRENDEEILMGNPIINSTRGLFYVYTNSGYPYAPVRK